MTGIKLVAVDIDGTLVSRSESRIVRANAEAISKTLSAGVRVGEARR